MVRCVLFVSGDDAVRSRLEPALRAEGIPCAFERDVVAAESRLRWDRAVRLVVLDADLLLEEPHGLDRLARAAVRDADFLLLDTEPSDLPAAAFLPRETAGRRVVGGTTKRELYVDPLGELRRHRRASRG